jgi:hypothetical protein
MNGNGMISKIFGWIAHPTFDTDTDPTDWLLGLVFVVILAFLWSRVVRLTTESV